MAFELTEVIGEAMDPAYHNQMLLFVGAFVVGLALPPRWIIWLVVATAVVVLSYGVFKIVSDPKNGLFEVLVVTMAFPIVVAQALTGGGLGILLRLGASRLLRLARLHTEGLSDEELSAHESKVERETRDLF